MQKKFIGLILGISFTASLSTMESPNRSKLVSINSKIRNVLLKKAHENKQERSAFNSKVTLEIKKNEKIKAKRLKKYIAHLSELSPSKLWHDTHFLIRAHIKTNTYYSFCAEYKISRMGNIYSDGTHTLELNKKYREAFAQDPRVTIVRCTDGSGNSAKALSLHLGFIKS